MLDPADNRLALMIGLAVLLLYLTTASGHFYAVDDHTNFETARAWLTRGELSIAPQADRGLNIALGPDGRHYPYYGFGTPLLYVPFLLPVLMIRHWIGPWHYLEQAAVTLLNPLLLALASSLLFHLARRLKASPASAAAGALLFAVGSLAWPWSQMVSNSIATGAVLLLLLALLESERGGARALGAGLMAGLLFSVRYETLLLLPGLLAWRHARGYRSWLKFASFFATGMIPWIAISIWYNVARFGHPLDTGYADVKDASVLSFGPSTLHGLFGLLLSPGRGLLIYSVATLITFLGWRHLISRNRRLLLPFLLLTVPPLLLYASSSTWHAGPGWGPRYLGLILPFLHLGGAFLIERWPAMQPRARALFVAVIVASILVQTLGVITNYDSLHDDLTEHGIDPLRSAYEPNLAPLLLAVRFLPELTIKRLDQPSAREAFPGGGHPATQNLRRTPDLWVFYAYKLGLPAVPFFGLWGVLIGGTVLCWMRLLRALKNEAG